MEPKLTSDDHDVALMARISTGDQAAFAELVERHQQRVLNIVYRYLGRESEAEDIAQEAFLRVYRASSRYQPTARFTTWLFQIVANLCLNTRRNRSRKPVHLVSGQPDDEDGYDPLNSAPDTRHDEVGSGAERDEMGALVREVLQEIPDKQRMALVLAHYEGAGYQEIGEALDMNANAAKQLCHRARESMRKKLDPHLRRLGLMPDMEENDV